jgi:hypothetical protein
MSAEVVFIVERLLSDAVSTLCFIIYYAQITAHEAMLSSGIIGYMTGCREAGATGSDAGVASV